MPLAAGTKLSYYEVLAPIGAGAMGEVWRARDTRLGREVAIKVLPEHFASDEERLRRFEREAKTLATVNHPNVAQIHGVDQVGDVCFLVLELVPGESLAERLQRGALPLDEALDVCAQIAAGLEAAHEAGLIHRDLKPANVRITPEGKVKVLDFGLAKPAREGKSGSSTDSVLSTEAGSLLGTPTYMAPEQARGRSIDRRVDVWAFGCVLYECLTGKRAFDGETMTDVLGAVLHTEPDLARLPARTPARVRELLSDCLLKDPRARARDIGEIRRQLERARQEPGARLPSKYQVPVATVIAIAVCSWALGWFATKLVRPDPRPPAPPTRFVVTLPDQVRNASDKIFGLALSPDGRALALSVNSEHTGIYLRDFDRLELQLLPVTASPADICFSPDGRALAYFERDHSQMRRVTLDGGTPQTIAAQADANGIAWIPSGSILTAPQWGEGFAALRVSDGGLTALAPLDIQAGERAYGAPSLLPGGKALLYQVWTGGEWDQALIKVLDLETNEQHVVLRGGTMPNYMPFSEREGALLYLRGESLYARRFDGPARTCRGDEVLLIEGIKVNANSGLAVLASSPAGTFAYQPQIPGSGQTELWWVDREGKEELATPEKMDHQSPSLSADGQRIVFARGGAVFHIYAVDLGRPLAELQARRLTFDADTAACLISPDGASMAYSSNQGGKYRLYVQALVGGAAPRVIFDGDAAARAWTRDGRSIVFNFQGPEQRATIWTVPADGSAPARPLVQVRGNAYDPQLSPDGEWLSFVADEDGVSEVFVVAFPAGDRRMQVTNGGGSSPRWSRDGSEFFFRRQGAYYSMSVTRQPALAFGAPRLLFKGSYDSDWSDVGFFQAPDGRFLMNKPILPEDRSLRVVVVEHFDVEVRAKLGLAAVR